MLSLTGPRRLVIVPLLAIVAVFVFAACSDDDDDGGNGGSTSTPAATEDATDAPTDTPADTPTEVPSGTGDAGAIDVEIRGFAFSPGDFTVSAGETVTFNITNNDGVTHNIHIAPNVVGGEDISIGDYTESICDGSADPCSNPAVILGSGSAVLEWTAPSDVGRVQFRCDFHPTTMIGVITVE